MAHLDGRYRAAWIKGNMEEAQSCLRFFVTLEDMSDADYHLIYE